MDIATIEMEIKNIIVDRLDLDDITIKDIATNAPLFEDGDDGLGLDSIESLELIIGIEQTFKVTVGEEEEIREHFYSVRTLADYVTELLAVEA
jgi:acyl carrier protein